MPMKFWRSSNSSKGEGKALAEAGRALGLQSVISLFYGREITADLWSQIAERYRNLTAASGGKPLEPEAEAAGILAQVICSPDAATARNLADHIPSAAECELYALTADAIVCDFVVRSNPGMAEPHAKFADSLYALMPKYYQSIDNYLAGSLRIISEYIAFFAYAKDVRGTLAEASSLTAGTSHLASRYGIYRYVDSVIEIGDRVLVENSGVTGRDAMGFWTVANNLANLHIALAQDQSPVSVHHHGKALTCAKAAFAALDPATGDDVPKLRETTLQKLAQLHMRLAIDQLDTSEHASEARRFAEEYASAASDRAAAAQWAARIFKALEADRSESGDAEYSNRAAELYVECSLATERIGEWPQESAKRIAAAKGGSEGRARIAGEILATLYDELAAELDRAIPASGFDWSVCKLLLALGAIASGRLGELTGPLVRSWLTTATAPQDREPWTAFRARQYMPMSGESKAGRVGAAGHIVGLAMLVESVQRNAPDVPFREMLRSHNSALLKHIVEGRPLFQECSGPALSCEADLDALQSAGRRIFRARFDEASRQASQTATGQHGAS
jgi:hypothetical protein